MSSSSARGRRRNDGETRTKEIDLQGKLGQNKGDTDGGVRTELRRKPEDKQCETCIEKRCSTLWSLYDEGEGLALLIFQKGAVKRLTLIKNKDFFLTFREKFLMMHFKCRDCHQGVALRGNHSRNQLKMKPLGSTDLGGTVFIVKDTFKVRNWCWTPHTGQSYGYCAPQQPTWCDLFTQEMRFPRCLKLKLENINYRKKVMFRGWSKNSSRQMRESAVFVCSEHHEDIQWYE